MNDVKEAAERLRRGPASASAADFALLAQAYLAEHDPTPIDAKWLLGLDLDRYYIQYCKLPGGQWCFSWHGWELPKLKTKYEVRRMVLSIMGIKLKGEGNG